MSSANMNDLTKADAMIPLGVMGSYYVNNNIGIYGVRPVIILSKNS